VLASLSHERPTLDQPRELVGVEASGDADPQVVAGLDDEGLAGDASRSGGVQHDRSSGRWRST